MSQEKVDRYKKEKANREKIMKKEKLVLRLEKIAIGAVCLLAVGWIGFSAYRTATNKVNAEKVETVMDATAIDGYLSGMSTVQ